MKVDDDHRLGAAFARVCEDEARICQIVGLADRDFLVNGQDEVLSGGLESSW